MRLVFDRLRPTAALGSLSPRATKLICAAAFSTNLVGLSLPGASVAAAAETASRWDGDARSAIRLIAGAPGGGARAAIELRLKPGWHTYWRYPGDAGVPPKLDFAKSENVKAVTVLWPAPQRIEEEGLVAIGYTGDVVWPLAIVPQNPAKPVTLRLKLDYAVCEKLCVPAEGRAELMLRAGGAPQEPSRQGFLSQAPSPQGSNDAAIATALARVPQKLALGEGTPLAIRAVRRENDGTRARAVVDIEAPAGAAPALFVEGPTAAWALPVPIAVDGAPPGQQRFAFDLDGAPPGAKYEGAALTLTAVSGEHAIEVVTRLD
jgi:DsbC/DsbD-like thiol-disulfide interchange protein